jgi:hypothetical protein
MTMPFAASPALSMTLPGERDFDGVAMAVQMTALAFVVRDAVPGIEFEAAGDQHGVCSSERLQIIQCGMLTTIDHRRDSAGLLYVYPVISRRAGGVSVGINLNTNNACNWACVYCQVDNLTRGGPPPIDLDLLESELKGFLDDACTVISCSARCRRKPASWWMLLFPAMANRPVRRSSPTRSSGSRVLERFCACGQVDGAADYQRQPDASARGAARHQVIGRTGGRGLVQD